MPTRPKTHRPNRPFHDRNARSGGTSRERGYTWQWEKLRAWFLSCNPLCYYCQMLGVVKAAECVDHYNPVEATDPRFMDVDNLRAACALHNRSKSDTPGDEYVRQLMEKTKGEQRDAINISHS